MRPIWRRRRRTVVVDLGHSSVKMAVAESAAEAVRFDGVTRVRLPGTTSGALCPEAADDLARLIRAEVERRGWQGMRGACLLAGSATSTQSFLLPPMPDADLRQAIGLKLRDTLHFDVDSACVGFRRVQSDLGGEHEGQVLVLCAAAQRDAVMLALDVMRRAGLQPVAVGAGAESLANLSLAAGLCPEGEATIHANIGRDLSVLNLFAGHDLRFSREIDVAGEAFTEALERPVLTRQGAVQLTREQAEEVKQAGGYPLEGAERQLPYGVTSEDILPLLEPVAQRLVAEFSRSLDYFRGLLGRSVIDRVVLSGRAGRMRNLDVMLQDRLRVPVRYCDPVARAMSHWRLAIRDRQLLDPAGFSAILGYSIGNVRPINLAPRAEQLKQRVRRASAACRGSAPLAAATGVIVAGVALPILGTYRRALASHDATIAQLDDHLRTATSVTRELERLTAEAALVDGERGLVPDWTGLLKELSVVLPAEAEIVDLVLTSTDGLPALRMRLRTDNGRLPLETLGARVVTALAASPFFLDVHVGAASLQGEGSDGELDVVLDLAAGRASDEEART